MPTISRVHGLGEPCTLQVLPHHHQLHPELAGALELPLDEVRGRLHLVQLRLYEQLEVSFAIRVVTLLKLSANRSFRPASAYACPKDGMASLRVLQLADNKLTSGMAFGHQAKLYGQG